ncbi:P-loop containing nucleoside triphosphate hydrolase protein, partial [Macrophomina phaseolina]
MRQLDRIVVDECHVVLNEQVDFRKQLQQLGKLMAAETQIVLLTATLPPSREEKLWRRMGWGAEEVVVFRAPTVRRNVGYRVVKLEGRGGKKEQEKRIEEMVEGVLGALAEGKVVVYCNTITKVEGLVGAGLFQCEAFHSRIAGGRKREILEDFRAGIVRVVVATSALGMGIDIPDI